MVEKEESLISKFSNKQKKEVSLFPALRVVGSEGRPFSSRGYATIRFDGCCRAYMMKRVQKSEVLPHLNNFACKEPYLLLGIFCSLVERRLQFPTNFPRLIIPAAKEKLTW